MVESLCISVFEFVLLGLFVPSQCEIRSKQMNDVVEEDGLFLPCFGFNIQRNSSQYRKSVCDFQFSV